MFLPDSILKVAEEEQASLYEFTISRAEYLHYLTKYLPELNTEATILDYV